MAKYLTPGVADLLIALLFVICVAVWAIGG
jgi:hypothetical protein